MSDTTTPHQNISAAEALAHFNVGIDAYRATRLGDASSALGKALEMYQQLVAIDPPAFSPQAAMTAWQLGNALAASGQLAQAVLAFRTAVGLFNQISNQTRSQAADLATTHMNLANALSQDGQLNKAIPHYHESFQRYQQLDSEDPEGAYRAQGALTQTNLANTLAEAGEVTQALQHYKAAHEAYAQLLQEGQSHYRAQAANVRMNRANVLSDNGQIEEAINQYESVLAEYSSLVDEGQIEYRRHIALTLMNLATAHLDCHVLPLAITTYRRALAVYDALLGEGQLQHQPGAALARMNLANALAEGGQLPLAVDEYQHAIALYQQLIDRKQAQFRGDQALAQMNLANALGDKGQLVQAVALYRIALATFDALVVEGQPHHAHNLARAHMNLGTVEADLRLFSDAIASYSAAQQMYQTLVEHRQLQFIPSLARTHMNRGTAYAQEHQLANATIDFKAALQWYGRLEELGQLHYRPNAVLARLNYANALARQDEFDDSLAMYEQVVDAYRSLIAEGRHQFAPELAHAHLNWGNGLLRQGAASAAIDAIGQYQTALTHYGQLVQDGHRQHVAQKIATADQLLQTSLAALGGVEVNTTEAKDILAAMRRAFDVLTPLPTVTEDSTRLHTLRAVMTTAVRCWRAWPMLEHHAPKLRNDVIAMCLGWLDQMAQLLAMGRPGFLHDQYGAVIQPLLHSALRIFVEHGHSAPLALWHLRTQGLRAQRQVIAAAAQSDAEMAELARLYARVEALDREIHGRFLARMDATATGFSGEDLRTFASAGNTPEGDPGFVGDAKLTERDRLFFDELTPLEQRLQVQGRLPRVRYVELDALCTGLRRAAQVRINPQALLLLIPEPATEQGQYLISVCLRSGDTLETMTHTRHLLPLGEAPLRECVGKLTSNACADGRAMRGPKSGPADAQASMTLQQREDALGLWHKLPLILLETLHDLHRDGYREVHIIPGGDLHLAPWAATLDQAVPNLVVRQFPSAASWLRIVDDTRAPVITHIREARWACLTCATPGQSFKPLAWVSVEALALANLWQTDQWQLLTPNAPVWGTDGQTPVDGLVAIGHGDAPDNNWAMAGLVMGIESASSGQPAQCTYLTSAQLHQIQHARRLVLSSCVLGQVRDSQGEPLGMAAQAFNFNTELAVGAMIPIPDMEGALWSMALHWAWAQGEQDALQAGYAMDWIGVFHATRRTVMAGWWPQGFGDWLRTWLLPLSTRAADGLDHERTMHLQIEPFNDEACFAQALADTPTAEVRLVACVTTCLGWQK